MIYVIYGTDITKVRGRVNDLVKSLLVKKPDATHMRITPESFSPGTLEEVTGSQGLFSDRLIVELDTLLTVEGVDLAESFSELGSSENVFVLTEAEIDAKTLKALEKVAEKVEVHDAVSRAEREPTMFALADALGARNKKTLWVEYQKALMNDAANEEIHGMLFWQAKSMLIASQTTEKDSGLKPFVYGKAKRYASNYPKVELHRLSSHLVDMYHESRRGGKELGSALEQWMLSL